MSLQIRGEVVLFLHSMAAGVFLLVLYDIIRIVRRVIPHRGLFVAAEDLLYWLFHALFLFYLMYRENSGAVRGYLIAGVLLGMLAYNRTVSPHLVGVVSAVLNRIKKGLFFLWRHTGKRLFGFLWKKYEKLKNGLKKEGKQFTIKLHRNLKSKAGKKHGKEKDRKKA